MVEAEWSMVKKSEKNFGRGIATVQKNKIEFIHKHLEAILLKEKNNKILEVILERKSKWNFYQIYSSSLSWSSWLHNDRNPRKVLFQFKLKWKTRKEVCEPPRKIKRKKKLAWNGDPYFNGGSTVECSEEFLPRKDGIDIR